ncbi:MAG: hypothetical protein KZQ92_21305 [Candidatus Thiodiazotropha sp. (ex Lucinoma borealis)]|nr:hypothetical protein [Candidatus Thiodiazotropha sp. (ex Lucinoma borealis)]
MGKVIWKESKVISIETMEGIYALAQMLKSPYMVFYNHFSDSDDWAGVELSNESILFCKASTRQFLKNSVINAHKEVVPLGNPNIPNLWIRRNPSSYKVKLWGGTDDELEFIMIGEGGGALIEMDIYEPGLNMGKVINPVISLDDRDHIDNCELTDQAIYPSFNERLFLCCKFGKNVSPDKDLIFQRPLSTEFKRYYEMLAGRWARD